MSGRFYWLSLIALLCFSTLFWWVVLAGGIPTQAPSPLVAILDGIVVLVYLVGLRWVLQTEEKIP